MSTFFDIGCPEKKVPVSHKKVPLNQKRAIYLDTAQQDKQLSRNFLWDKETYFFFWNTDNFTKSNERKNQLNERQLFASKAAYKKAALQITSDAIVASHRVIPTFWKKLSQAVRRRLRNITNPSRKPLVKIKILC